MNKTFFVKEMPYGVDILSKSVIGVINAAMWLKENGYEVNENTVIVRGIDYIFSGIKAKVDKKTTVKKEKKCSTKQK